MGHQSAGGNGSWCPELESRATHPFFTAPAGLAAAGFGPPPPNEKAPAATAPLAGLAPPDLTTTRGD